MAASLDSTRWLREVAIDVRGNPDWTFALALHTRPGRPPAVVTPKMTVFTLDVWAAFWCVTVYHRGTEFQWERRGSAPAVRGYVDPAWQLVLPIPKLESVRSWLTRVEDTLDVTFHRDRPGVKSNVKGAAKLLTAWIKLANF